MWRRRELKDEAKHNLKYHYWGPFLICLIFSLLGSNLFDVSYFRQENWMDGLRIATNLFHFEIPYVSGFQFYAISTALVGFLFRMFVINPMHVGRARYFLNHAQGKGAVGDLGVMFRDANYWNVVKIMFLKDLKIILWSLCFVIPGIIKAIEYSMIPYLLAQQSGRDFEDAFTMSKQMTSNEKGNIFLLSLSFFPWYFVLGMVWFGEWFVNPYYEATYTQLFITLKQQHGVY